MQSRLLSSDTTRTYVLVFDEGDEVVEPLKRFAREQALTASSFTAIGAFSSATLGFFDLDRKDYARIPVDEQVEVLTLAGNVTCHGDEPKVHAHAVLGRKDGATLGGHLLEARVRPTLEVMLVEQPATLQRTIDERTGLPLLNLDGG